MSNKTCGECRFYAKETEHCKLKGIGWKFATDTPCSGFTPREPITNGDKIRQMSNAELAGLIVPKVMFCDGCPVKCEEKDIPPIKDNPFGADVVDDVCKKRVEAWLNAPAESEVEDEQ